MRELENRLESFVNDGNIDFSQWSHIHTFFAGLVNATLRDDAMPPIVVQAFAKLLKGTERFHEEMQPFLIDDCLTYLVISELLDKCAMDISCASLELFLIFLSAKYINHFLKYELWKLTDILVDVYHNGIVSRNGPITPEKKLLIQKVKEALIGGVYKDFIPHDAELQDVLRDVTFCFKGNHIPRDQQLMQGSQLRKHLDGPVMNQQM